MSRHALCSVAALCLAMLGGCSIVGSWKTVRIEPAHMAESFAFSSVVFGNDGRYSAVAKYGGKSSTMSGRYEWSGFRLKITSRNGESREYRGNLWWGKTLHLRHECDGESVTGVLERRAE